MRALAILALSAGLSGCAASTDYMHETSQPLTVNSIAGAHCTGTREGAVLFSAVSGQTVTITKSKNPIVVACQDGPRRAQVTLQSSLDSLSFSPLWDMADGSASKYPPVVFVDLGGVQ